MKHSYYEFRVRRVKRTFACERFAWTKDRPINDPLWAATLFNRFCEGESREVFMAASLDVKNMLIGIEAVATGCLTGVEVHMREAFRSAILVGAAAVIFAHNHPSGSMVPSSEDLGLAERATEVGELLGIPVLDQLIVTGDRSNFHAYSITQGTVIV